MDTIQAHRFCVLPYANALPLVRYIKEVHPPAELICRTPRSAVQALLKGMADAALIPIVGYFSRPDLIMIPGLGICADGDVTSVLLQCYRPLSEVRGVRLDPESRTSNILVQVLMRDHFRISHRVEYGLCADEADARVCIGDRALCATPALETYDLAGEWKKMTGLPFVFAVWAMRRPCPDALEITQILHRAKVRGCQSLVELARLCAQRLGLPENRCHEYLADRLHYDVGPAEREGMSLFRGLAAGLLEQGASQMIKAIRATKRGKVLRSSSGVDTLQQWSERISAEEALDLLTKADTAELMSRADNVRRRKHGTNVHHVHSPNLNPTNLCENRCGLCAFWREPGSDEAYTLSLPQAEDRLKRARGWGLTDVHIVGGLNRELDLTYYIELLRIAKRALPTTAVQALTAVEVQWLSDRAGKSVTEVPAMLKTAGLDALPGGGAEIFSTRVRENICPKKISADRWLHVHRVAHDLGIPSNATMLFGHVETPEEIVQRVEEAAGLGATQIVLQGGLNPALSLSWYKDMLRAIKDRVPAVWLHSLSPAEVLWLAQRSRLTLRIPWCNCERPGWIHCRAAAPKSSWMRFGRESAPRRSRRSSSLK